MRAWEIENWTKKRLRRKAWDKSEYLYVNKNGHWSFVDKTGRGFGLFLIDYTSPFVDLMSANDVEEYFESNNKEERSCDNCGTHRSYCECCAHFKRSDLWIPKPKLPDKTKNLTWQEAYEAWKGGWEVVDPDQHVCNFEDNTVWYTKFILKTYYQLTGKRR